MENAVGAPFVFDRDGKIKFLSGRGRSGGIHPYAMGVLEAVGPCNATKAVGSSIAQANGPVAGSAAATPTSRSNRPGTAGRPVATPELPTVDVTHEPYRTVVENTGALGSSKAAAALAGDAQKLASAVQTILRTEGGTGLRLTGMRHPLLDSSLPGSLSRDPVCRAVVRLQRARVLAAAHALSNDSATAVEAQRPQSAASIGQSIDGRIARPATAATGLTRRTARERQLEPKSQLLGYGTGEMKPWLGMHLFGGVDLTAPVKRPGLLSSDASVGRPGTSGSLGFGGLDLPDGAYLTSRTDAVPALNRVEQHMRRTWASPPLPPEEEVFNAISRQKVSRSVSPTHGRSDGGTSRPGTAMLSTSRPGTAIPGSSRPGTATASFYRPGSRGPGGLSIGVPPLPRFEYTSRGRVASAALRRGRAPTAAELVLGQQTWAQEQEERSAGVKDRLAAIEAERLAHLDEVALKETKMKNRTVFLRRQRAWMTVVGAVAGLLGARMKLADEKMARSLASKKLRAGTKIAGWMRQQYMLRGLKALARKRRIVMSTVGRWIRRRKTRRLVAATRIVRAFLTQAAFLTTQVRTVMQYRTYTRSLRRVSAFLVRLKLRSAAQARLTAMMWTEAEAGRRDDLAAAIATVYQHGTAEAAPPVLAVMRTLSITTPAAALARAQLIQDAADRWNRSNESAHARGSAPVPRLPGARAGAAASGLSSDLMATASSVGYTEVLTMGGVRVKTGAGSHTLAVTLGAGSDALYSKYSHPADRGRSASVDAVAACLLPMPEFLRNQAIARFLLYRRQERWDEIKAWRRKVAALQPFLQLQRRRLELVQRISYKGPSSLFVFDKSEYDKLVPPPPKRFRNIPSRTEVAGLAEVIQDEYFAKTGIVWAAEEAGMITNAVVAAKGKGKVGGHDADDRKLEKAVQALAKGPSAPVSARDKRK